MKERIASLDWAQTPLGPSAQWPQSLRSTVKTLLASRYPMILTWGPQLIQIYNDAYSALIGDKHPAALGQDIRVTMAEAWGMLGPLVEAAMTTGEATWVPALLRPRWTGPWSRRPRARPCGSRTSSAGCPSRAAPGGSRCGRPW